MNEINLTLVITAALGLIFLISWFQMVKNVKEIKQIVNPLIPDELIEKGLRHEFEGDKALALKSYIHALFEEAKGIKEYNEEGRTNRVNFLKEKYGALIGRNGGEWPDFNILLEENKVE